MADRLPVVKGLVGFTHQAVDAFGTIGHNGPQCGYALTRLQRRSRMQQAIADLTASNISAVQAINAVSWHRTSVLLVRKFPQTHGSSCARGML